MDTVIHTNMGLANQRETAGWLREGFRRHGINAEITANKTQAADVIVVQGPWWCYDYWRQRADQYRVLWLNRCFYGDSRFDLSLGWLRCDGSRDFRNDGVTVPHGKLPGLKARKDARRAAIILPSYGEDLAEMIQQARQRFDAVFFRPHPLEHRSAPVMTLSGDLAAAWQICDVAIGHSSTVLIDALINGLHVESTDPRHVVHKLHGSRRRFFTWLSWAQWSHLDLVNGKFWEHLCVRAD